MTASMVAINSLWVQLIDETLYYWGDNWGHKIIGVKSCYLLKKNQ